MNSKKSVCSPASLVFPGELSYDEALDLQQRCRDEVKAGSSPGYILVLEHDPPVITLGRHASEKNIICRAEELYLRGIDLRRVSRGGDVTAHEPGQLVIYYVLPVTAKAARDFVAGITEGLLALISTLSGKAAWYDDSRPGIWIGAKKVASLGLDLTGGVSMHGAAVNICNSLETFRLINPCGGALSEMSTLSREAGRIIGMSEAIGMARGIYGNKGIPAR